MNYSANYADIDGVKVTAVDFDSIAGLEFFSSGFVKYFLDCGYTVGVDIQIASYDWRLAPGKHLHTHNHTLPVEDAAERLACFACLPTCVSFTCMLYSTIEQLLARG